MPVSGIYTPKYLNPSGTQQTEPVNIAGHTPAQALKQGQGLLAGQTNPAIKRNPYATAPGPGSSMTVGPNGEVETHLTGPDPFASRLGTLSKFGLLGSKGPADPGARVEHAGIDEGREAAARDAAFARAKDRAGMVAQAGMKSLKNIMASRGLQGSSIETQGAGELIGGAAGQLGGVLREQAINEAGRAGDISDLEYQGGIQQRGQDIQAQQALLSLINAAGVY